MTTPMKIHGADLSHYQSGALDWDAAKRAGVQWVYYKVTEGNRTQWLKNYLHRRAEAKKHKMPFGAYHFARANAPTKADAVAEAQWFLKNAQPEPGDLIPALDLETTQGLSMQQLRDWAQAFVDEMKRHGFPKITIYGNFDLGSAAKGHVLWRPRYNNDNRPPVLKFDIFQFSNGVLGVPNHVDGFGHCDLNHMRDGLKLKDLLIPVKKPHTPKPTERVKIWHFSGQFSDTDKEHAADAVNLFNRASAARVGWLTTTEGGPGTGGSNWAKHFVAQAKASNFLVYAEPSTDVMIAVSKSMVDGGWKTHLGPIVVPGKAHDHAAKRVLAVQFENDRMGIINITAGHYLTKGRPSPKAPEYRQHLEENKTFAKAIGEYMNEVAVGKALGFYGGDQNIVDKIDDTFLGQAKMITAWDETKHYENTGHGNIDVIARYTGDTRTKFVSARAFTDAQSFFNGDHYLIEAVCEVTLL